MASVRAVDAVGRTEAHDRADRAALLADAGVGGSVDEPFAGELEDCLLEGADQVELSEHRPQQGRIGVLPVLLGRR